MSDPSLIRSGLLRIKASGFAAKSCSATAHVVSGSLPSILAATVESVSPPQTVYLGMSALIVAKDVVALAGVSRVWAVIKIVLDLLISSSAF